MNTMAASSFECHWDQASGEDVFFHGWWVRNLILSEVPSHVHPLVGGTDFAGLRNAETEVYRKWSVRVADCGRRGVIERLHKAVDNRIEEEEIKSCLTCMSELTIRAMYYVGLGETLGERCRDSPSTWFLSRDATAYR